MIQTTFYLCCIVQYSLNHRIALCHGVPGHLGSLGNETVIRLVGVKPHVFPDLSLLLCALLRRRDPARLVQKSFSLRIQLLNKYLQLLLYQKQVQRFFNLVLDVDSAGHDPQQQVAMNYLYDSPKDPDLFHFRPIPLSFEPVEPGRCSSVLYSGSILDMIDYALRSCVERGITVRRCKNCGRYFP